MIRYATSNDLNWIVYLFNQNQLYMSYNDINAAINVHQVLVDSDTNTALVWTNTEQYVQIICIASQLQGLGGALAVLSYLMISTAKPVRFEVPIGSEWENYILTDKYAKPRHTLIGTHDNYHIYECRDERFIKEV